VLRARARAGALYRGGEIVASRKAATRRKMRRSGAASSEFAKGENVDMCPVHSIARGGRSSAGWRALAKVPARGRTRRRLLRLAAADSAVGGEVVARSALELRAALARANENGRCTARRAASARRPWALALCADRQAQVVAIRASCGGVAYARCMRDSTGPRRSARPCGCRRASTGALTNVALSLAGKTSVNLNSRQGHRGMPRRPSRRAALGRGPRASLQQDKVRSRRP